MNRLGFVVIYDENGYIDESTFFLIKEMYKNTTELIVIANGIVENCFLKRLKMYTKNIIIRNNYGLDAGAYAEVMVENIGRNKLNKYDEIVLCNDTFFGPLIPLKDIFSYMDGKECDFWGIDKIDRNFLSYIIMYFCVFRKKIISSGHLYEYFEKNIYNKIRDIHDAFARFEVGLYYYLNKMGYIAETYTNTKGLHSQCDPDVGIIQYNLPIIKKKFFTKKFFNILKYKTVIELIKEKYISYDINILFKCVDRKYKDEMTAEISDSISHYYSIPDIKEEEINNFLRENKDILIYGYGSFGRAIEFIFRDKMLNFLGYIVSRKETNKMYKDKIFSLDEQIPNASIIVALNKENTKEIKNSILGLNKNILFFWDNI